MLNIGHRKVVVLNSNGALTLDVKPPPGQEWYVYFGLEYHDDTGQTPDVEQDIVDSGGNNLYYSKNPSQDAGESTGGAQIELSAGVPTILNNECWFLLTISALTAGHNLYCKLDVLEYPENFETWWYNRISERMNPQVIFPLKDRL